MTFKGRPSCQRCTEGGDECLGYGHIRQRKTARPDARTVQYGSMEGVFQLSTHTDTDSSDLGTNKQVSNILSCLFISDLTGMQAAAGRR